nr:MAG TPA: hypothetical protein [Caudoviricetes sp.]
MYGIFVKKEGKHMEFSKGYLKVVTNKAGYEVDIDGITPQELTVIYSNIIAKHFGVDTETFMDVMLSHLKKTIDDIESEPVYEDPNEAGYDAFTGEPIEDDDFECDCELGICYDTNGDEVAFEDLPDEVQAMLLAVAKEL